LDDVRSSARSTAEDDELAPPIIAPAASWNMFGVEPRLVTSPVRGSNENTPPTEVSEESSPPARYTVEPSATATSR
jgi:hypothetical protein